LTERQTNEALLLFAFIPARYDLSLTPGEAWPGGLAADNLDVRDLRVPARRHEFTWCSIRSGCWPSARRWRAGSERCDSSRFFCRRGGRRARSCILLNAFRSVAAVDRRLGGDLGRHGGGDAFRVPARRSARAVAQPR
jgi:hypothetical protein